MKPECNFERDLTPLGEAMLRERYFLPHEKNGITMLRRVATAYGTDKRHSDRMFEYMKQNFFMPATPILANAGRKNGLPISCFLSRIYDNLDSIIGGFSESAWLAARGGGIGIDWSNLRSIGEKVGQSGKTSGIIPFIRQQDSQTLAISQGSLRRGSSAAYLHVSHPEIEEFINIRRPTGDPNRQSQNIHNAVVVPDAFMHAVEQGLEWELRSPSSGAVIRKVSARELWQSILTTRLETGEPYIIFADRLIEATPIHHRNFGLYPTQSNLCSEITLPTNENRTAVCCLGSVNLLYWSVWRSYPRFIYDCLMFLDNVLQSFINETDGVSGFEKARYSAMRERSVGLGVMGFHTYLQHNNKEFAGHYAVNWNKKVFEHLRYKCDDANLLLASQFGSAPDCIDGYAVNPRRFSYCQAVAPTASISTICGGCSPGIEPTASNIFVHKTLDGSHIIKNRYLEKMLSDMGRNTNAVWQSITENNGSVQHLKFLDYGKKQVFLTAEEISQRHLVRLAADRSRLVDQAVSNNLWIPPDVHKRDLHEIHFQAWQSGVKSLYYLRSRSVGSVKFKAVEGDNCSLDCESCQ